MRPINPQMKYGNIDTEWQQFLHRDTVVTSRHTAPKKSEVNLIFTNRARIVAWCPGCRTKGAGGVQHGFISAARFEFS